VISFRHHLVSLVAVFLALAVGVVLGGGPLSELGRETGDDASPASHETDAAARSANAAAAFADRFAAGTAARTLAGGLDGQTVVLMSMPGADPTVTKDLAGLVKTAGGAVVGEYAVRPALVDPSEKSLVDTLGSQLATSLKAEMPAGATTYVRMGRLIGMGVATSYAAGRASDANAHSVVESLKGAELMTTTSATRRGALVLLVLGDEPDAAAGVDVIVSGLVTGLSQIAGGAVVAGSTESGEKGLLSALRGDQETAASASTTDSVQTGAGRVTAVLALAAAKDDKIGSFGASGSDGAVPLG